MLPHTVTYRSGQLEPEGIHLMRKSRENEPCPSWCLGSSVEAQSLAFPGKFLSPGCQSDLECLLLGFSHLLFLLFFESFALVIPLSFFFSFFLKKKKNPGGEGKLVCIVCMQRAPQPLSGSQCLQAPLDLIGRIERDWESSVWNPRSKELQQPVLAFHCLSVPPPPLPDAGSFLGPTVTTGLAPRTLQSIAPTFTCYTE